MRVRFSSPAHENRYWWAIIECDGRFLVCARERLVLPDGLVEYTVADRWNGIRGHVPDGRSGVTGACRPADAAWLLEQAKAQGDYRHQATACGRIQTGERQVTRFDQTGVTLTKYQNNAALGVNILPDAIGQRNQHELHWRFS